MKAPKYLTKEEVQSILNGLHGRDHLIINFLWQTGVRVSELINIKVQDIDFYSKTVSVATLKRNNRPVRIIPLTNNLAEEIKKHIQSRNLKSGDSLFPYTRFMINYIVLKACKKAKIDRDRSHPHTFRHSFAVQLALNNTPVSVLQNLLGHANINNTMIYTQIAARDSKKFIDESF